MISPRRAAQSGFTLLELIIAMTLAALVVALGASILRMGMDFYQRSHAYIHRQQEVRGFLKLLRDELQGATKGTLSLSGERAWLNFTSDNMPAGINRGGQNRIVLECRDDGKGKIDLMHRILPNKVMEEKKEKKQDEIAKLGAAKPETGKVDPIKPETVGQETPMPEIMEEALVRQLSRCAFSYLLREEKNGKAIAAWANEWPVEKERPLAVRVHLAPPGGNLPPVVLPLN